MEKDREEKIKEIKDWLKTGSINVFGLPMSGKDTVAKRLAEVLEARMLSSGEIIRETEKNVKKDFTSKGNLAPTEFFTEVVLPYFGKPELAEIPLILSSVGRWFGEEDLVISALKNANHELKAVILLNVSEEDVKNRWEEAKMLNDRGERADDIKLEVFEKRILEFREKTMPVIVKYNNMGILVPVKADSKREVVFDEVIEKLYKLANPTN